MALTVVQSTSVANAFSIPGGNFAQGTRAMVKLLGAFPSNITAGNIILVAIGGDEINSFNPLISLGPIPSGINTVTGGSLPSRVYYAAISYTDASGIETMATQVFSKSVPANNLLELDRPNVSIQTIPNAVSWNVYAGTSPTNLTLQQSGIAPNTNWTEPSTGITNTGSAPVSSPLRDTLGNTYNQAIWTDGGITGTQFGNSAMGVFWAVSPSGGANTVTFDCGCFNPQPFAASNVNLNIILVELNPGTPLSIQGSGVVQQGSGAASDLSILIADSSSTNRTSDFGLLSQRSATVVDLTPNIGADYFFAILCGLSTGTPTTPTITGGTYTLILGSLLAPDQFFTYLWFATFGSSSPVSVSCNNPPNVSVGQSYSHQFLATGGTGPYTFSITGGALPPGITMNSSGLATGVPLSPGTFNFTVKAVDSLSASATVNCSITVIGVLTLSCNNSPVGQVGQTYNQQFLVSNGVAPYTFSITSGSLPPGLSMNSSGLVTGVPTTSGTFVFTLQVVDHSGTSTSLTCSITINPSSGGIGGTIINPRPCN